MKKEAYEIAIGRIEKETEKAAYITFVVSWNGNCHNRSFWVPKSQFKMETEQVGLFSKWFMDKLSAENNFKGYHMYFEGTFEGLKEL